MQTLPLARAAVAAATAFVLVLAATPAGASDGRIEISQTRAALGAINGSLATDPAGFPVVITLPGSYVLTSNLTVDANTTAIRIQSDEVSLDLNGFGVVGPRGSQGTGIGIEAVPGADRVAVSDGFVVGTGSHGVQLRLDSRLERVSVFDCKGNGVVASSGTILIGNRASENDLVGFSLTPDVGMAMNASTANGGEEVVGGYGIGDNVCDGRPCRSSSRRRFYLTTTSHDGAAADTACAPGFRMASIWEIRNPENLHYDTVLGVTRSDSGSGPPAGPGAAGWARTGLQSAVEPGAIFRDMPNCAAWSSNVATDEGTRFNLTNNADDPSLTLSPWEILLQGCNVGHHVWCVED